MKTANKSISSASFTAQIFRLTVNKLRQIIAVRWVGFTGFVLLCVAFRYFVVLKDENLVQKTNQINIKNTYTKMEIWPAEIALEQYLKAKDIRFKLQAKRVKSKNNQLVK